MLELLLTSPVTVRLGARADADAVGGVCHRIGTECVAPYFTQGLIVRRSRMIAIMPVLMRGLGRHACAHPRAKLIIRRHVARLAPREADAQVGPPVHHDMVTAD